MAVTLTTAARNAAADAVVDLLDGGSGDATGDIAFSTSAPATLCVNNLAATAFGAASSGVATAATIAQGTVATAGTIALALFRNKANTEIFRCAVGTSGSDINLSSVAVSVSDTIDVTSLTYTQPAS
jgi:hypothetical protein